MNDPSTPNRYGLTTQVMDLVAFYTKTLFVPSKNFTIAQLPIPMVTTLKNVSFEIDKSNCDDCLDYTFATLEPHRTDGWHAFTFVPNISIAQSRISVLTERDTEPHPWPAELRDLQFIRDPNFPITTVSIKDGAVAGRVQRPRIYLQRSYLKAATLETPTRTRYFISNTEFPARVFVKPQPLTTEISWAFGTSSGELDCLHDDVTIPSQSMVYEVLYGTDFGTQGEGDLPAQFFPRTNFKRRSPYDVVTQQKMHGMYVLAIKTYYPPSGQNLTVIGAPGNP